MISLRQQFSKMETFLGKARSLMQEFSEMMTYAKDKVEHKKQQERLFMVLTLSSLPFDLENVRQQILSSADTLHYRRLFVVC